MTHVAVIGGGLAGAECAWQLARFGVQVRLYEMRPERNTPAHETDGLAELVCSNSFRSDDEDTAIGRLKRELEDGGSLIMRAARETRLPAGKALAVDRTLFSEFVTREIERNERIELVRCEIHSLDAQELTEAEAVVVAAGPLASDDLADNLKDIIGGKELYFYDAIAPIVAAESVDMDHAFWGSRYRPEDDDYLNCPLTEEEYHTFIKELLAAEKVAARDFEKDVHFEGCLPIEEMASRGEMTLAFGPLKPVGLVDPKTEEQPFAVLQLRAENAAKTSFNLVGFQTKLKYPEQKRVFGLIPGLAKAEYLRLGSIHRNTYVNAPRVLTPSLELKKKSGVYLAGQITGVEGYLESAACGFWVGLHLGSKLSGKPAIAKPPIETALGALLIHLETQARNFQPSNANFGLMPPLNRRAPKRKRKELYAARARESWEGWLSEQDMPE